ncbi:MAG: methyl-accepting chemotaxis protein, partial [Lachnospiraceae bacterium]|nr:methyl-accepting chemotaxis protein [Lachnospiraceae bacterium]
MAKQGKASAAPGNLTGFASIKQTVALLTLIVMIIIAAFGEIIAVAIFSSEQEETMQKSMRAVARAYSIMMNNTPPMEPAELRAFLSSNLSGIKINDIESSYIMVVNRDSVVEFHGGDASRIGNVTINEVLTGITQQMRNKTIQYGTGGYASYTVNGVEKFSSYYVTTDGEYVVCAVMDKKDVTAAVVAKFLRISILIYLAVLVVIAIISYFIVGVVVRPVKIIEQVINRVAKFDLHFEVEGEIAKILLRRDEFGVIARAVQTMIENLTEVLNRLNMSSDDLNVKASSLKDGMGHVSENSSDNSA